jgi:hypothetical protein
LPDGVPGPSSWLPRTRSGIIVCALDHTVVADQLRETKVDQQKAAVFAVVQEVVGLDVSVYNPMLVLGEPWTGPERESERASERVRE